MLGEGAFAVVRKLRNRRTGELAALKVVEKYPLHIRNMLPQLQREVRIQGNLQHRNILRLLRCLEDDAYVYMLLEYCAGGSLRTLCGRMPGHRLPEPQAAWYFVQILQGVDWMHHNACVHRDLKPENMLLTEAEEVRICDFGWSAEVQIEQSLRTTCGTPHYWAPELFEGMAQDVGVDLWALGTLIYELLVGHAPFWGTMEELRRKVLAVDLRYPPGVLSHEAINLFYCLLQREPQNRIPANRLLAEHPWVRPAILIQASRAPASTGACGTVEGLRQREGSVSPELPLAGSVMAPTSREASAALNGAMPGVAVAVERSGTFPADRAHFFSDTQGALASSLMGSEFTTEVETPHKSSEAVPQETTSPIMEEITASHDDARVYAEGFS
jgi:serine/threonine protein kinase